MKNAKQRPRHPSWLSGAQDDWRKIDDLYAQIITASERGDQHARAQLRRRLFYLFRKALQRSRYKGRLLGALGDSTLRSVERLKTLLLSYSVSEKEGDVYNCLLVADSLAAYFVEWRKDGDAARFWIAKAAQLMRRVKDKSVRCNLDRLTRMVQCAASERPTARPSPMIPTAIRPSTASGPTSGRGRTASLP